MKWLETVWTSAPAVPVGGALHVIVVVGGAVVERLQVRAVDAPGGSQARYREVS